MATIGQTLTAPESGWKRYDGTNSMVVWSTPPNDSGTLAGAYNNTYVQSNSSNKITIRFYGTKVRIIGACNVGYSTNIQIKIDGVYDKTISQLNGSLVLQALNYENTNLSLDLHTLEMSNLTAGTWMLLDAIDVDSNGYLTPFIGQRLVTPDVGWKRYEETDGRICYNGTWTNLPIGTASSGTCRYSDATNTASIKFRFNGTKLRIIGYSRNDTANYSANIQITIDGTIIENYTCIYPDAYSVLLYEKIGLSNGTHQVEIHSTTSRYWNIDAIDVEDTGKLTHLILNEKTSLTDMQIGDVILCEYVSPGTIFGNLENIGSTSKDIIPSSASSTPNGSFYFIHTGYDYKGRMKLIADRNVQYSVSWDTLNNAGIASPSGIEYKFYNQPNCYLNSSDKYSTVNISNFGRTFTSSGTGYQGCRGNIGKSSGKWYYEVKLESFTASAYSNFGIATSAVPLNVQGAKYTYSIMQKGDKNIYDDSMQNNVAYSGSALANSDVIGIAFDLDAKKITFYRNGSNLGDITLAFTGTQTFYPFINSYAVNDKVTCNFRPNEFVYTPPTGYQPLETTSIVDKFDGIAKMTLRLLTGGTSSTDTDNEWDKIIVNSTLNEKITAGNNTIWNWNGISSWTSTINISSVTQRTIRGNSTVSTSSSNVSSAAVSTIGFRPVLIVEILGSRIRYLIQDGNNLKTIENGNLVTIGSITDDSATKANLFSTKGLTNFSGWSDSLKNQLQNIIFKILMLK